MNHIDFTLIAQQLPLRLPEKLEEPGLLVGWSLEHRHPDRPIGFTFGDPVKSPSTGYIDPIQLAREGHLVTIAPTGAGKGVGCIVPALLLHDGPVIVIDPKGENVAITARRRRELGHEVFIIDPMGVTGLPSHSFNPLDSIDINSPLAVDEAAVLVHSLWGSDVDSRDRFWVGRAQQLLIGMLLHLLADRHKSEHTLASLRELIAQTAANPVGLIERFSASSHPEVRSLAGTLGIRAEETLGGYISFAQEMVDFLRGPLIQSVTNISSFSLDSVTRGDPISIYIVLPPHMLESHGRMLRLWISALLAAITRRRAKPDKPTLFILDEAAQLGMLPQLRQALTLLRGYGLQTWSFWQDVSQLMQLYPRDWQTMVNNCRVLQCFGALNTNAASDMANMTGFGDASRVIDLKNDEMILQLAGDEAVIARLPNYLTDPVFAGLFDPNPYYQQLSSSTQARPPIRIYERDGKINQVNSSLTISTSAPDQSKKQDIPVVRSNTAPAPLEENSSEEPEQKEPDLLLKRLLNYWA